MSAIIKPLRTPTQVPPAETSCSPTSDLLSDPIHPQAPWSHQKSRLDAGPLRSAPQATELAKACQER
jgi:hypothetical protein